MPQQRTFSAFDVDINVTGQTINAGVHEPGRGNVGRMPGAVRRLRHTTHDAR